MTQSHQTHMMGETHYQRAVESTGIGIYYRDLASRHVVWSDEAKAILGLPADAEESCDLLLSVTHPEDRERLAYFLAQVDVGQLEGGVEHRVIWSDGSVHWVLARRGVIRNELGEPVRLLGVTVDITALKQAEDLRLQADRRAQEALQTAHERRQELVKELERKQAFMDAIMEQAPSALVIAEAPSGKVLRYNQEAGKLLDKELLESQHYLQYPPRWHEDGTLFQREEYPLVRALVKGEVVVREPMRSRFKDGRMRHLEVSAAPVYDEEGRMLAAVATFNDASERFELERKKDEFICVASHELRTPLTSLKGSLQLIQRRLQRLLAEQEEIDAGVKSVLEYLAQHNERALYQANVESRLVNDLLDATRLQSGELHVCLQPCNLVQIVQQEVVDIRAVACARVIDLDLPEVREVPVLADRVRIRQVVANFLTNALKYSPAHQPVQVGLSLEGKQARVWVRDYGRGLSPEAQSAIWDRFRPAATFADYTGMGIGGLGLGLHTSRELIKQHGGETGVESVLGEGSTFWLTLPLFIPDEIEQRLRQDPTGAYRWFLAQAIPHRDRQGEIVKWIGGTDIDEQKQAEVQVKESEENWRVLAEAVPQLVWTIRAEDGLTDYFNQRFCDYTQATAEQLYGYGWSQFLHPEDYQRTLAARAHALCTGTPYEVEYRLREGQTGRYRWFLARGMPVRNDAGQITKWFGTCTDIDRQKQAEQQVKESEENWRVLAEAVPQFVWTINPSGQHEYANQRWYDYSGSTFEHLQSDPWSHLQFIHPDDQESSRAHWQRAMDTGALYEHEERLKHGQTGTYRWFLVRGTPVRDEAGQIIKWFGTCTDIDGQKRILCQSQAHIRALIDSNLIGIICVEGEEEVLVQANEAFLHLTGYSQEEIHSRTLTRAKVTLPEDAPLFERAFQELVAHGQHTPFETEVVCKDGSHLPILVGGVLFQEHPRQIVAFVLDNTARKELEQRKDNFISMASHELRNPLTALKLQTTLLHRQLVRQGCQGEIPALANMQTQINKTSRLVEELLDVSKIRTGSLEYVWERVDLDALLREITETMQHAYPSHRILVHGALQTSLMGDRDRLGQLFTNLLSNAIKYSPGAQTVEMDLCTTEDAVTVCVRDQGVGIPREQQEKIFERFYRAVGPRLRATPGLGIGLYLAAEIVKRHGGSITVDSTVGKGSTFTVTLPKERSGP